MLIRQAVPADASRLAEILVFAKRTTYRKIFQDDAYSFGKMQVLDLALSYRDDPRTLDGVLVYDDGIVKGMLSGGPCRDGDQIGAQEIYELYVDPFFQGTGVGSALLHHFLALLVAHSFSGPVLLWVLKDNFHARACYEHFNFRPDGMEELVDGTNVIAVRYRA